MQATHIHLPIRAAIQLAAPPTWGASIIPCIYASVCALVLHHVYNPFLSLLLLFACICMQSSVNTFNDYFDYKKQLDSPSDDVAAFDSALVYGSISPRSAFVLAWVYLIGALACGSVALAMGSWLVWVCALVGIAVVYLYSGGPFPLCYAPVGELVSGTTMGYIMPLACYCALTNTIDIPFVLGSIPNVLGIALIMMTNNACDIEKDQLSNRRTLPVVLGRTQTRILYKACALLIVVYAVLSSVICFHAPFASSVLLLLVGFVSIFPLMYSSLQATQRRVCMTSVCNAQMAMGLCYSLVIASALISLCCL